MRHFVRCSVIMLLGCASALCGCVSHSSVTVMTLRVSPDSTQVAYSSTRLDADGLPIAPNMHAVERFGWLMLDAAGEPKLLKLGSWRWNRALHGDTYDVEEIADIKWSPDSRRVALLTNRAIHVVEPATEKIEQVCSFEKETYQAGLTWTSSDDIAWWLIDTTESETSDGIKTMRRLAIFRGKAAAGAKARQVYLDDEKEPPFVFRSSPDGRFLIIRRTENDRTRLVDLHTGRVTLLGPPAFAPYDATWKPDGSAVLLTPSPRSAGKLTIEGFPYVSSRHVLLVELPSGTVKGLTTRFAELGDDAWVEGDTWTADGKFVVVRVEPDHILLQPDPWRIIPLPAPPGLERFDRIKPLAAAGWVCVEQGFMVTDQTQPGYPSYSKHYAMDYSGKHLVFLTQQDEWTVTPDGRLIVAENDTGKLTVRKLDLPAGEPSASSRISDAP